VRAHHKPPQSGKPPSTGSAPSGVDLFDPRRVEKKISE
jgi:hypothetical protein